MTSFSIYLVTTRYVTNMLFLPISMPFSLLTVRAGASNSSHSLFLHIILVHIVLRRITLNVLRCCSNNHTRSNWCIGRRSCYLRYNLPFIGIIGILLDMLTNSNLGCCCSLLCYNLNITKTYKFK